MDKDVERNGEAKGEDLLEFELEDTDQSPGIIRELGDLPPGTIISENKLAEIFHRCPTSIKRAIKRGELPPSTRLFGQAVWTVEIILKHLQDRLADARKEAELAAKKLHSLRP